VIVVGHPPHAAIAAAGQRFVAGFFEGGLVAASPDLVRHICVRSVVELAVELSGSSMAYTSSGYRSDKDRKLSFGRG
jgi:hypothetical protein